MANKCFTDESLSVLVDEIKNSDADSLANAKSYTDVEITKTKVNIKQYLSSSIL